MHSHISDACTFACTPKKYRWHAQLISYIHSFLKGPVNGEKFGIMISSSMILSCITPEQGTRHLPSLPIITKLELNKFKECHYAHCTSSTLYSWLKDIFGESWPSDNPPTIQVIMKGIDRLVLKFTKLQKQPSSSTKEIIISSFLKEEYALPKSRCGNQCQIKSFSQDHNSEIEQYQEQVQQLKLQLYASNRNAKKRQGRRDALKEEQKVNIRIQKTKYPVIKKNLSSRE